MIVLPSRGRPDSLKAFFEGSQPSVPGVVMLDMDDSENYDGLMVPKNWTVLVGPRTSYVSMLNIAFNLYPDAPFYAYGGDDIRCRPIGWDTYLAASAGRSEIAYGNDLINGDRTCCLPFIGGDLVRRVGWLGYPGLSHLYCDTIWRDLGRALKCLRYSPEIVTEHLHWSTGKAPYDQTAKERKTDGDQAVYADFTANHFTKTLELCAN